MGVLLFGTVFGLIAALVAGLFLGATAWQSLLIYMGVGVVSCVVLVVRIVISHATEKRGLEYDRHDEERARAH